MDFLKDILLNGFWPRYCLEDARWYTTASAEYYLAYPIVCFCDIPLSRVDEHVTFYGNYGIGVTKRWAESNGLAPVLYIRENSTPHEALKTLFSNNRTSGGFYDGSAVDINTLLTHVKPIKGSMYIGENLIEKEFYQESEWRFGVSGSNLETGVQSWLPESTYRDENALDTENKKTKELKSLKISPTDIKYLFVKSDSDIPAIVNFIQTELDMYPSHDVKILLSRIISLETISHDL